MPRRLRHDAEIDLEIHYIFNHSLRRILHEPHLEIGMDTKKLHQRLGNGNEAQFQGAANDITPPYFSFVLRRFGASPLPLFQQRTCVDRKILPCPR